MRRSLILAFALLTLGLAACGGGRQTSTPHQARTARMFFRSALAGKRPATLARAEGVFDFRANRGRLRLFAPIVGALVPEGSEAERERMSRSTLIIDGAVEYVYSPDDHPKRPWLKQTNELAGVDLYGLADPTQGREFLQANGDRVQEHGREAVRGAQTTRYRVNLDLEQAAKRMPPSLRRQLGVSVAGQKGRTVPIDVWIDDAGRIRRTQTTNKASDVTIVSTTEYFDFGVNVSVSLPPAEKVRTQR